MDVLAWTVIVLGALCAAAGLGSLITGRRYSRRPNRGAHARPPAMAEPGARGTAWREIRTYLLLTATGAVWLVTGPKRNAAAQILIAVIVIVIVLWELGSWLRAPRGRPGAAWQELPRILLPAMPSLAYLASGWSYTKWVIIAFGVVLIAPDLDSWLRPRLRRGPGDTTTEPP